MLLEKELDALVVMALSLSWHSCFLDSLPYKLVEILNPDELFGILLSMIVLTPQAAM